jgi:hypothetical protein
MEQEFKVEPYGVKYICGICDEGEMLPTGNNNYSAEREPFEHKCNKCGDKRMFSENYPLVRYRFSERLEVDHDSMGCL